MSNTFDKLSVLDSFIEEVNSYLPEIETNLERLAQSPGDMDALEETYRRTHTIGGSASMMDFPGLAHVAHGMEDILGDALDGLIALDDPALGLLQRSLGRLRQLLEGIRSGIDEEAVIAEDDADYAGYRTLVDNASDPAASGVGQIFMPPIQVRHQPCPRPFCLHHRCRRLMRCLLLSARNQQHLVKMLVGLRNLHWACVLTIHHL